MIVLGLDLGIAHTGWCLMEFNRPDSVDILEFRDFGVIETVKNAGPLAMTASEDNFRRVSEVYEGLRGMPDGIYSVCVEAMSFPRSSSAAAKTAMCWGALAAIVTERCLEAHMMSPQAVKKRVCGVQTASKLDVQAAVEALYPETRGRIKKSKAEHAYDAVAVTLACVYSGKLRIT